MSKSTAIAALHDTNRRTKASTILVRVTKDGAELNRRSQPILHSNSTRSELERVHCGEEMLIGAFRKQNSYQTTPHQLVSFVLDAAFCITPKHGFPAPTPQPVFDNRQLHLEHGVTESSSHREESLLKLTTACPMGGCRCFSIHISFFKMNGGLHLHFASPDPEIIFLWA